MRLYIIVVNIFIKKGLILFSIFRAWCYLEWGIKIYPIRFILYFLSYVRLGEDVKINYERGGYQNWYVRVDFSLCIAQYLGIEYRRSRDLSWSGYNGRYCYFLLCPLGRIMADKWFWFEFTIILFCILCVYCILCFNMRISRVCYCPKTRTYVIIPIC